MPIHHDVEEILRFVVHLEFKQATENPVDFAPQNHESAEHCCHMQHDGESEIVFAIDAEKIRTDSKVTATAHWQILGEALNKT